MYSEYTRILLTFDYASIVLIIYVDETENRMLSRISILTGACSKYTMRNFEYHLPVVQRPTSVLGNLIVEFTRSHTIRHTHTHLVGLH